MEKAALGLTVLAIPGVSKVVGMGRAVRAAGIGGYIARQNVAHELASEIGQELGERAGTLEQDLGTVRRGYYDSKATMVKPGSRDWEKNFLNKWQWLDKYPDWRYAAQELLDGMDPGEVQSVPGHNKSEIYQYVNDIRDSYRGFAKSRNKAAANLGIPPVNEEPHSFRTPGTESTFRNILSSWLGQDPGAESLPIARGANEKTIGEAVKKFYNTHLRVGPDGVEWQNGTEFRPNYLKDHHTVDAVDGSGRTLDLDKITNQADLNAWINAEAKRLPRVVTSWESGRQIFNDPGINDVWERKYPLLGNDLHNTSVKDVIRSMRNIKETGESMTAQTPEIDNAMNRVKAKLSELSSVNGPTAEKISLLKKIVGIEPGPSGAYPAGTISDDINASRGLPGAPHPEGTIGHWLSNIIRYQMPLTYQLRLGLTPSAAIADPMQQGVAALNVLGTKGAAQGGLERLSRAPIISSVTGKNTVLNPNRLGFWGRMFEPFGPSNEYGSATAIASGLNGLSDALKNPRMSDYINHLYTPEEQSILKSSMDKDGNIDLSKAGDLPFRHVANVLESINGTETPNAAPAWMSSSPLFKQLATYVRTPASIASANIESLSKYGHGYRGPMGYGGDLARGAIASVLQPVLTRLAKSNKGAQLALLAMSGGYVPMAGIAAQGAYGTDNQMQIRANQDLETFEKNPWLLPIAAGAESILPNKVFGTSDLVTGARNNLDKKMGASTNQNIGSTINTVSQYLPGIFDIPMTVGNVISSVPQMGLSGAAKNQISEGGSAIPLISQTSPYEYVGARRMGLNTPTGMNVKTVNPKAIEKQDLNIKAPMFDIRSLFGVGK